MLAVISSSSTTTTKLGNTWMWEYAQEKAFINLKVELSKSMIPALQKASTNLASAVASSYRVIWNIFITRK